MSKFYYFCIFMLIPAFVCVMIYDISKEDAKWERIRSSPDSLYNHKFMVLNKKSVYYKSRYNYTLLNVKDLDADKVYKGIAIKCSNTEQISLSQVYVLEVAEIYENGKNASYLRNIQKVICK